MDLLWGDAAAHLARHSLAQALTVLKEKVGREHLVVQRATVALAEGAVDADVAHLDACDLQIRGAFLDGFEVPAAAGFEQWKDEWRARLGPRIRDCLVKQMDAGRRIGDFATVERHAQVLHELDPLSEDAVRGLMEARAWVGDRTNALKAYARFEERLREELGAKPSTDLVRVADLLRQGRRPAPRPDEGARAGRPAAVSERQERRFEAETLIGREQPFAKLYDAWLEVRRRVPRIVVLTGDPGIGKTTLTNAFVSTCQMEGAVVARAQAYDAERELPFAILAELVKQLTLQRAIGGAEPEALSELSRVSPELFNVFPGVPKPVEWSAEVIPLRLAGAFLKAVEAATDESPLVLVVDDIHAADNASAAILHMVARKLSRTRLLLILTGRTNELRTAAAPSALVSDTTVEALQTLELEPLSAGAGEALTRLLEEGFLREVHGTLEFRNELIRAQAYYAVAGPARQHLHRSAGELLAAQPLHDGHRDGLEIAWHFLRGGAELAALPHALDGADAALTGGAPFEAEQVLTVVMHSSAPAIQTQGVRLRLARALMDQSKASAASSLLASLLSDRALAPRDAARAANMQAAAEYLLARETGLLHSQAAERALSAARATADPELLAQALVEYAKSGIETGAEERVQIAQGEIAELLKASGPDSDAALHLAQGYCHYFFYDPRSAAISFETAVNRMGVANPVQLSFAYNGYGISKHCLCELREARQAYAKALELAIRIGDDSRASIIGANLCCASLFQGDYQRAIEHGERSVALGLRSFRQPHLFTAYANLAEAYLLAGLADKALERLETARVWVSRHPTWRAHILFLLESACFALILRNVGST